MSNINIRNPLPFLTSTENNLFIDVLMKIKQKENKIISLENEAGDAIFLINEDDEYYVQSYAYSIKKLENEIISLENEVFDYIKRNEVEKVNQILEALDNMTRK